MKNFIYVGREARLSIKTLILKGLFVKLGYFAESCYAECRFGGPQPQEPIIVAST